MQFNYFLKGFCMVMDRIFVKEKKDRKVTNKLREKYDVLLGELTERAKLEVVVDPERVLDELEETNDVAELERKDATVSAFATSEDDLKAKKEELLRNAHEGALDALAKSEKMSRKELDRRIFLES